jgi:citrate lyase subunit beta/citryl-CoA lyase
MGMIRGMIFGNNDYSAQFPGIHADDRGNLVLQAARASMLELAHEFGLIALDGPSRNLLPDDEGVGRYRTDCEQGRSDGFDGKQTINLAQIVIVNEIFSPSRAEIEQAETIKQASEAAIAAQKGAVNVGGSMTETMHYAAALATLKLRDAIAEVEARQTAHRARSSG